MKTLTINLYSFEELNPEAKEKAIEEHRNFLLSVMHPDDFLSGCQEYDTQEELQKTYEAEYKHYSDNDEPIIENIIINDYLFLFDGELLDLRKFGGCKNEKI